LDRRRSESDLCSDRIHAPRQPLLLQSLIFVYGHQIGTQARGDPVLRESVQSLLAPSCERFRAAVLDLRLQSSAVGSAFKRRDAQGNPSQFNSLDFELPWFGTRRLVAQLTYAVPRINLNLNGRISKFGWLQAPATTSLSLSPARFHEPASAGLAFFPSDLSAARSGPQVVGSNPPPQPSHDASLWAGVVRPTPSHPQQTFGALLRQGVPFLVMASKL
jgi:hypothetical protein